MDRLTKYDMDAIMARREQFTRDCESPLAPNERFLKTWACNKDIFLGDLFEDKLILQVPFAYEASIDDLCEVMSHKLTDNADITYFINEFRQKVYENFSSLSNRLRDHLYWDWFEEDSLVNNYQYIDDFTVVSDCGKKFKFQKGSKVVRNIRKIAKFVGVDEELLTNFINIHSQVLNQKFIKGNLCYSIHPLDYMTMSDNREGWDSCMSWDESGCYRLGTLEMMNSPCVVVAYLSSDREYALSNKKEFFWNSKKWRTLMLVTPDLVTTIKSYPYSNRKLEQTIVNEFREKLVNKTGKEFSPVIQYEAQGDHYFDVEVPYPAPQAGTETFHLRYTTDRMYNDFGSCRHYGSFNMTMPSKLSLCYSGPATCICCGEEACFESDDSLYCEHCDGTVWCQHCGDRISIHDACEINGNYYCHYCYIDNTRQSMLSEYDEVWLPDAEKIYIDFPDRKFGIGYLHYGYVDCSDISNGTLEETFGPLHFVEEKYYWTNKRFYSLYYDQIPDDVMVRITGMHSEDWIAHMNDLNSPYLV